MRLHTPFVRLALRVDASLLAAEMETLPDAAWRSHPEAAPGNTAVPLVAAGGDPDDDATLGAMSPTPWLASMPYHRTVLAALGAPIGRCRLMRVAAEGQLGAHVDTNRYWQDHMRVHVPVVTDPSVRFECDGTSVNMAAGEVWVFDTWRRHGVANPAGFPRTHLVIDTVGSSALWRLIDAGEAHGTGGPAIGTMADAATEPTFEACAPAAVTGPWQHRAMVDGILTDLGTNATVEVRTALRDFLADWHATWVRTGDRDRQPFAALLEHLDRQAAAWATLALPNGTSVAEAVRQLIVRQALAPTPGPGATPTAPVARRRPAPSGRRLDRPVFIVCPPRSGSSLLFEALSRARDLFTIGGESHQVIESIPPLHPSARGWDSNRLTADDAAPAIVRRLEEGFADRAHDRDDRPPHGVAPFRLLEKTPKNALRVPFLAAAFPDARFVYLHRDPQASISSIIEAWRSGRFVTYPQLPHWPAPAWSLLLTPGWQQLAGRPIEEIAAAQWTTTTELLLDDLGQLDPTRWCAVRHEDVVADPDGVVGDLARRLGLEWDRPIVGPLPASKTTLDAPAAGKWRRHRLEIDAVRHLFTPTAERAERAASAAPTTALAQPAPPPPRPRTALSFDSRHTASFGELLTKARASIAVTTYQAGRVALLRAQDDGTVNTHLSAFARPMGLAASGSKVALGTDRGVWFFENQPALAARLPDGVDACFVPRRQHVTGDISIHEMAFAGDELWVVNTRFSCLATLDAGSSFTPRWRPRFVTALAPEDRCHLNGMAVVDGRPKYVTALAMTDTSQGWRAEKLRGGVVIDVDEHSVVAHGLTMPHSPRWYRDALYVLDSGEGQLCKVDLTTGTPEPIVRLPGFVRGLAFIGRYAIVGLSRVREHVFAGLPLAEHVAERRCGVWLVDLETATVAGFLRFEGDVDEVFDIQVLPAARRPLLLEPDDAQVAAAFVLPDEVLPEVSLGGQPI